MTFSSIDLATDPRRNLLQASQGWDCSIVLSFDKQTHTHARARANIERQLLLVNHISALLNSTRPYHLFLPLWVDAEAAKIGAGGIHIWPGLEQLGSPWHTRAREGNSWCSTWCCDSCCKASLYFFPKLSWRKLDPLNAPISCCWKNPGRRILCDAALHVPCISAVFLRCQAVPRKMFQGLGTLGKSAYKKQWLRCSGICWQMVLVRFLVDYDG